MSEVVAHAIAQVEPPAVGIHLLWTGPWQWVWSLKGWSIQRREVRERHLERVCVRLDRTDLQDVRLRRQRSTELGPVTIRSGRSPEPIGATPPQIASGSRNCEVVTLLLDEPTHAVDVEVQANHSLGIAMSGPKAVDCFSGAGTLTGELRASSITAVVLYTGDLVGIEWCVYQRGDVTNDPGWAGVPYLVENLQLPLHELDGDLTSSSDELNEAQARLLPGESLDPAEFANITDMLRASAPNARPDRPADQVALLRSAPGADAEETMAVDPMRVLLVHPKWRRVLGFGYFDDDPALQPGEWYEYRITGWFPIEDLTDRVYCFHTTPSGIPLPSEFWLDDLRLRLPQPVVVDLDPTQPPAGNKTDLTRRGITIKAQTEDFWLVPDPDGTSLVIDFPSPVSSVVLESAPGSSLDWETGNASGFLSPASGTVSTGPTARIDAPLPFEQLRLYGDGFLYAVRVPSGPTGVNPKSVVLPPIQLVDTPRPEPPLVASIANLQQANGTPEPGDPPAARHALGFRVSWRPAPTEGLTMWPSDAPAPPPLDAAVYEIHHREVNFNPFVHSSVLAAARAVGGRRTPARSFAPSPALLSSVRALDPPVAESVITAVISQDIGKILQLPVAHPGSWKPLFADGNWILGDRDPTRSNPVVLPRSDVFDAFPEPGNREVANGLDVRWMDVFDFSTGGNLLARPVPQPGTHHQYRIRTIDAIGRPSHLWRQTNVARLEKHVPPPLPGPSTQPPAGGRNPPEPTGVFARALVKDAPDLTAADLTRLGTDDDVVVLSWGWHQSERDQDPYAREFRVYFADHPLDRMDATVTSVASGSNGSHTVTLAVPTPLNADELVGTFLHAGAPFRVVSNSAGSPTNVVVEARVPNASGAPPVPATGPVELTLRLTPARVRPPGWSQRVATVAITPATAYEWEFRNVLNLSPSNARARVWVGVSAADDQAYVPDQLATGSRPGNESGLAIASVEGAWHGRPVFEIPPTLEPVAIVRTPEPADRQVRFSLDLGPHLGGTGLTAGDPVMPERVGADVVFAAFRMTTDDKIMAVRQDPNEVEVEVTVANPSDHAAIATGLASSSTTALEDRYVVFLAGSHPDRDQLFVAVGPAPVLLGPFNETLPPEPGRWVYRFRRADAAGHLSAGAALAKAVVRVPSVVPPGTPERAPAQSGDTPGTIRLRVPPEAELTDLLSFVVDAVPGPAPSAAVVRVPNRPDLSPAAAVRLRLSSGEVLTPAVTALTGTSVTTDADGWRNVAITTTGGTGATKRLWAVALSTDGIPSLLAGPWSLRWPPAPLPAPVLTGAGAAASVFLAWTWPGSPAGMVAVERSIDGGEWTRVSPPLPETSSAWSGSRPAGTLGYRLRVSAVDGRTANSNEVTV